MAGSKKGSKKCSPTFAKLTTAETVQVIKDVFKFKSDGSLRLMCGQAYLEQAFNAGLCVGNLDQVTRGNNFHRPLLKMFELHNIVLATTECVRRSLLETIQDRRIVKVLDTIEVRDCDHGGRPRANCLISKSINVSKPSLLAANIYDLDLIQQADMHRLPCVWYHGIWNLPQMTIVKPQAAVKKSLFKRLQQEYEDSSGQSLVDNVLNKREQSATNKKNRRGKRA